MGELYTELAKIEIPEVAELYHFWSVEEPLPLLVPGHHEYWTSWQQRIAFDMNWYIPAPISRTPLSMDNDFKVISTILSCVMTQQFLWYIANYPLPQTMVDIYRVLVSDPDETYKKIFSGYVNKVTFKDQTCSAECVGGSAVFLQKAPKIIYQAYCNHDLFDSKCQVLEASFSEGITDPTQNGSEITHADLAGYPSGFFTGGTIKRFDFLDYRLVTNHVGDTITLQAPFAPPIRGYFVVSAGCDKNPETCEEKFDNLVHFLGFPYIPQQNPIIYGFK